MIKIPELDLELNMVFSFYLLELRHCLEDGGGFGDTSVRLRVVQASVDFIWPLFQ